MKKILTVLLLNLIFVCCAVGFSACGGVEFKINFIVDGEIYATVNTNGAETIKMPNNPVKDDYIFDGWFWDKDTWQKPFTANSLLNAPLSSDMSVYAKWIYNGENIQPDTTPAEIEEYFEKQADGSYYGKVYNTTDKFDFNGKIQSETDFYVCKDSACTQTLNDNTTSLNLGDNVFYILFADGNKTTATVRRRIICTVNFDTANGTIIESQQVYEDTKATMPKNPMRLGYTFSAWYFDFNQPITANTTITALWNANTNTPYKIEYYLQNLENDEYTLQENDTENLTGTTDTTATATKTYEHFTVVASTASANINSDGLTVLQVYYTRDKYTYTAQNENTKGGTITCTNNGTHKFNTKISLSATLNAGYDFLGWFNGETKISNELQYSFNLFESVSITAKYFAHTDTPYKVEYWLENLDGSYSIQDNDTETLQGTTDTMVNKIIDKSYEHFIIMNNTVSGNISGNGTTTLKVYYNLETFTVNISSERDIILNKYPHRQYKYGESTPEILATFNNRLGYKWKGWYSGDVIIYEDMVLPSFVVDKEINYIAKCEIKEEMSNYYFDSTTTTCEINGVKDKTVTEIIIPDYVTSIRSYAFHNCSNFTSITIPENITSIGIYGFSECASLLTVNWNATNCINAGLSDYPIFSGNINLTNINIASNVTNIPSFTFKSCRSVKNVVFDENSNLKNIDNYAFAYCKNLEKIAIPNSIESIGSHVFDNCDKLEYTQYDNGLYLGSDINPYVVLIKAVSTEVTLCDINEKTKIIYHYAFRKCEKLKSIIIPNSVVYIGSFAFSGCQTLNNVEFGENITFIGNYAFEYCNSLTKIITPNKIKNIGYGVFWYCFNLTDVTIGENVEYIEKGAFDECALLNNVKFEITKGWKKGLDANNLENVNVENNYTNAINLRHYLWVRQ